ncbi:hypothetical protein IWQ61_001752 [Dispira simplex]|nr:hypothetical protein IWQ61_001752 [Dispira simplex]
MARRSTSFPLGILGRYKIILLLIFAIALFHVGFVYFFKTPAHLRARRIEDVSSFSDVRVPVGYNESSLPVRAAFATVVRNSDLYELRAAIRQLEDRFNNRYHYPYVFLSDEPFTDEFKEAIAWTAKSKVSFGLIPRDHWEVPDWIDRQKMRDGMTYLASKEVIHSESISYRQMTRYYSGFFYKHPLLANYDYYWRIEHDTEYTCDIPYDPFLYMKERGIHYGYTISLHEFEDTVKSFWEVVQEYLKAHPTALEPRNTMDWVTDDGGQTYNLCHFWTNFEVVNLGFLRSSLYEEFFQHMDKSGGIFYERWGDAPIRSVAMTMFLRKEQVHWFDDIGYVHSAFQNCPSDPTVQMRCHCNPSASIHRNDFSCTRQWNQLPASY